MEAETVKLIFHTCFLLGNLYLVITTYLYYRRTKLLSRAYSSNITASSNFDYVGKATRTVNTLNFTYEYNHGYTFLYDYHGLSHKTRMGMSRETIRTLNSLYLVVL